jgi:hypothetical protein
MPSASVEVSVKVLGNQRMILSKWLFDSDLSSNCFVPVRPGIAADQQFLRVTSMLIKYIADGQIDLTSEWFSRCAVIELLQSEPQHEGKLGWRVEIRTTRADTPEVWDREHSTYNSLIRLYIEKVISELSLQPNVRITTESLAVSGQPLSMVFRIRDCYSLNACPDVNQ